MDIQELAAYKTIFNDSTHAIKMMPSSAAQLMTPQHLEAAKKLSVQELNVLDPETHKRFYRPTTITDVILQTRGQVKIFQLRFGSMRSDFNRNDLLIQAIFDDTMPLIEPTPQSSDKSLAAHDTENIGAQMVPPLPHFSQSKFQDQDLHQREEKS
ncbi:early nodulin-like protein 7 [Prunus dulcis]|uniref:Early nodulin-like protein 7 n=1 Tax=Prunus dulcis TaxID=3755 RepID=A0A4Y1RPN2_PRUDU|nr:early nodulin-like protein 7 [Prunus dulcis]